MSAWTDKQFALALKLWKQGQSATQIGQHRQIAKSRNAVIGKMSRAGLKRGPQTHIQQAKKNIRTARRRPRPPKFPTSVLPIARNTDVATKSFNDMDFATECAFIPHKIDPQKTDQDTKMYCGKEKVPRLSWCYGHCLRVYHPIYLEKQGIDVSVPEDQFELA